MSKGRVLDISWGTIAKLSAAVLLLYIIYLTKDIIIWFLFALTISLLFNPLINALHRKRVPRVLAVIVVYIIVFGLIGCIVGFASIPFAQEIKNFSENFSTYLTQLSPVLEKIRIGGLQNQVNILTAFGDGLEKIQGNVFSALSIVFGGIFVTFFIIMLAVLLSFEDKAVEGFLMLFFAKEREAFAMDLWRKVRKKVSAWFGTRVLACLFVGLTSYLALAIFDVQYPLSFGVLAGILNFIPIIGPLITGAIVFLMVVATDSLAKAVIILVVFILIQQVESGILTPALTKKIIGVPPSLALVALAVGGRLWGILGAVLVIPLVGILFEFLKDYLKKRKDDGSVML